MEDQNKLSLNDLAISALRESAKWCLFLAIVGFVFIGLMLIFGVFITVAMAAMPASDMSGATTEAGVVLALMASMKGFFGVFYIVLALIYFFPVYYLFNYAKGMKDALASDNEDVLANALVNLKSHHKFFGIMTIIMLSIYILVFVVGIIFAASFASSMH